MLHAMVEKWKGLPEWARILSIFGPFALIVMSAYIAYSIYVVFPRHEAWVRMLADADYVHIADVRNQLARVNTAADEGKLWAYIQWRDGSVDLVYGQIKAGWFKGGHIIVASRCIPIGVRVARTGK